MMHADADAKLNKLSVLSVLGSALIGYRQGRASNGNYHRRPDRHT